MPSLRSLSGTPSDTSNSAVPERALRLCRRCPAAEKQQNPSYKKEHDLERHCAPRKYFLALRCPWWLCDFFCNFIDIGASVPDIRTHRETTVGELVHSKRSLWPSPYAKAC